MLGAYAIGQQAMDPDAGLKPGYNHGQGSCCRRVAIVQIVRYGANFFAQFPNVPTIATEYAHPRVVFNNRVQLSIDRFQQRGFSGTIWTQNGDSLVLGDHEVKPIENTGAATPDGRVAKLNKSGQKSNLVG
jgi:hypothetical protein